MAVKEQYSGRILRALRAARGYSQSDVAEKLGVDYNTYAAKESGKRPFTVPEARIILELFGVKFEDIFLPSDYKNLVVKSVRKIPGEEKAFYVDVEEGGINAK